MAMHGKMSPFDATKDSWTSYIERLKFYFKANGINDGDVQKAIFITVIGAHTYELLKSLLHPKSPQEDDVTLKSMTDKLRDHFSPKPSPIMQRYKFHTRVRKPDETIATYVAELRSIGEHCDFGESLNAMIRDGLVYAINNTRIQCCLLQEADLTYEAAFQKPRQWKQQLRMRSKCQSKNLYQFIGCIRKTTAGRWNVTGVEEIITPTNVDS